MSISDHLTAAIILQITLMQLFYAIILIDL